MEKMTRLNVKMEDSLKKDYKRECLNNNTTMKEVTTKLLKLYIKDKDVVCWG